MLRAQPAVLGGKRLPARYRGVVPVAQGRPPRGRGPSVAGCLVWGAALAGAARHRAGLWGRPAGCPWVGGAQPGQAGEAVFADAVEGVAVVFHQVRGNQHQAFGVASGRGVWLAAQLFYRIKQGSKQIDGFHADMAGVFNVGEQLPRRGGDNGLGHYRYAHPSLRHLHVHSCDE